jgi:hypothetical protein
MAKFTTRVELHEIKKGEQPNYELLHACMKKQGFSQTIKSESGTVYELPTAEYNIHGEYAIETVLDLAKLGANNAHPKYSILVTEVAERKFYKLKKKD